MKKKIIGLFLFFFIAIFLYIFFNNTLTGQLLKYGIKINAGDLKLTDKFQETSGTNKIDWLVADSQDKKLFFSYAKPQDANKYIQDKIYLLTALYEPGQSPYHDVITNVIECPPEFKPIKQNFGNGLVYKLFAGERYNFGICTKDLIKYDAYYGLFDCKSKGIFELRLFGLTGVNGIKKIITSFNCNN